MKKLILFFAFSLALFGQGQVGGNITQPSSGSGGPPSGAAGGGLTGTYPNPGISVNQLNQNASPITYNSFGDSITAGTGASGTCNGGSTPCYFAALAAYTKGWTLNDQAVGGAVLADQMVPILAQSVTSTSYSSLLIGQNESSFLGSVGSANWNQYYKGMLAASIWLSTPASTPSGNRQKIVAQNASVTKSGTWTNVTEYGGAMGLKSTLAGDTLTASIPGSSIYVVPLVRDTTTCQFSVSVDGTSAGVFSPTKVYDAGNGSFTYMAEAIRVNGLAGALQHTIVVTDVAPGTVGCEILFLAGSGGSFSSTGPYHYLLTPYHTNQGQPYSFAQGMDSAVKKVGYELASDGLAVSVADISAYVDMAVNTALTADNIHPSNAGHLVIANAFLNRVNNLVTPQEQVLSTNAQNPEFGTLSVSQGAGQSALADGNGNLTLTNTNQATSGSPVYSPTLSFTGAAWNSGSVGTSWTFQEQPNNGSSGSVLLINPSFGGSYFKVNAALQGSSLADTGNGVNIGTATYQAKAVHTFCWANGSTWFSSSCDTGISRVTTNEVAIGNGTQGDHSGTVYANCVAINDTATTTKTYIVVTSGVVIASTTKPGNCN